MIRYLLCELDGEHYTQPSFEWHDSLDKAKAAAVKMLQDWWDMEEIYLDWENKDGGWWASMDVPDEHAEFEVFQIFAVDDKYGKHICVWHHAYEGVDFKVVMQHHSEDTVGDFMKRDSRANNNKIDWENDYQVVVDTDIEWEMWNLLEVR